MRTSNCKCRYSRVFKLHRICSYGVLNPKLLWRNTGPEFSGPEYRPEFALAEYWILNLGGSHLQIFVGTSEKKDPWVYEYMMQETASSVGEYSDLAESNSSLWQLIQMRPKFTFRGMENLGLQHFRLDYIEVAGIRSTELHAWIHRQCSFKFWRNSLYS